MYPIYRAQVTKLALLNIRSLTNKSNLNNDFISAHGLDFMPLTETWLNDCSAKTVLIKSAPPNFNFTMSHVSS